MDIKEKIMLAAVKYVKHIGYDLISPDFLDEGLIVAKNDDNIVFIDVFDGFKEDESMTREYFEQLARRFLEEHPEFVDMFVRYDIICLDVISESRAFLRHHINAQHDWSI